jgi:hypothetical protein
VATFLRSVKEGMEWMDGVGIAIDISKGLLKKCHGRECEGSFGVVQFQTVTL